jgi:hypothetical protein
MFLFVFRVMFDWEGDIAIDDIKLAPGLCGKNY